MLELAQPQAPVDIQQLAAQAQDPLRLAYLLGSMLSLDVAKRAGAAGSADARPRRCGCCTAT